MNQVGGGPKTFMLRLEMRHGEKTINTETSGVCLRGGWLIVGSSLKQKSATEKNGFRCYKRRRVSDLLARLPLMCQKSGSTHKLGEVPTQSRFLST